MSESKQVNKRTRRPPSLSNTLTELRDQKRRTLAKLIERQQRLRSEVDGVTRQAREVEGELERLTLAIGDARDTERADVVTDPDGTRHAVKQIGEDMVRMPLKDEPVNGAGA